LLAAFAKAMGQGDVKDGVPMLLRVLLVAGVLGLVGLGLAQSWVVALGWTALAGFTSTFCGVTLQAMVQMELPDDLRGRVMSLWVVVGIGAVALGSGALGWVAGIAGLPATLVGAGLAGGLVTALMVLPSRAGRPT
jgi:hypothetical protein